MYEPLLFSMSKSNRKNVWCLTSYALEHHYVHVPTIVVKTHNPCLETANVIQFFSSLLSDTRSSAKQHQLLPFPRTEFGKQLKCLDARHTFEFLMLEESASKNKSESISNVYVALVE